METRLPAARERESKYKGRDQRESKYKFTINQLQAISPVTATVYVQLAISRPSIKIKDDRERERLHDNYTCVHVYM